MRHLTQRLNELCDPLPFQTSWYLKNLSTGERADPFDDITLISARRGLH
jgi:hypothetical protein